MDTPMTDTTPSTGQVQVHFTTSDPDLELPEGKRQLLVPTDVRRYGLSQILNSEAMLGLSSPIPFDILINGHFLRTTLSEYLTSAGLSPETTITLQYVRSLIPPLYAASFEHDDWVSSIDILSTTSAVATWPGGNQLEKGQEKILSGSYDGLLRVWNKSGQTIATSASSSAGGHTMSIKDAKFISPSLIASASMDCTLRLWKYSEAEDHLSAKLSPAQVLYGHKGMVSSLSVHGKTQRILSASGDGNIGLWTTDSKTAPAAREALIPKRRKLSTNTPTAGPLALIKHHTAAVQAAIFHPDDPTVAYSCSLDHTVRTTDLSTQKLVDTRTLSHALISLSALPGITSQLLAAGTTARHITLLDPRVSSQTTQVMTLRGHTNMINSIAPDPTSNYGLVSGSHDGTCRIWDLRSTRSGTREEGGGLVGESVYVIERESIKASGNGKKPVGGEGVKVFGVKWDTDLGIVSAGEDKMVQINRSPRT